MAILHKLANTLLEKEVLDGHQIDTIIKDGAVV
jgi:ATP-dependent Zn protease